MPNALPAGVVGLGVSVSKLSDSPNHKVAINLNIRGDEVKLSQTASSYQGKNEKHNLTAEINISSKNSRFVGFESERLNLSKLHFPTSLWPDRMVTEFPREPLNMRARSKNFLVPGAGHCFKRKLGTLKKHPANLVTTFAIDVLLLCTETRKKY